MDELIKYLECTHALNYREVKGELAILDYKEQRVKQ
jgi:hypothetical protein